MTDRHRATDSRLNHNDPEVPQPVGPEPREPSDNRPLSSPANEREPRLFGRRKVLVVAQQGRRRPPSSRIPLLGASALALQVFALCPGWPGPELLFAGRALRSLVRSCPEQLGSQRRSPRHGRSRGTGHHGRSSQGGRDRQPCKRRSSGRQRRSRRFGRCHAT
jgi:hypothetical protein